MDNRAKLYLFLGIAITSSGTLTAIVYSRNETVIYFWECTAAVRVCNLQNAIIFFALSTIAVMGLLYFLDALPAVGLRKRQNKNLELNVPQKINEKPPQATPGITRRFAVNLEKMKKDAIKKGWKPTGLSLGFLDSIKTTPPFLGQRYEKPIISKSDEKELTEFFEASIYIEKYRDVIKGGRNYIVIDGDTPRTIAKHMYGDEKYVIHIPMLYRYPNGMILELPYINLETPHDHEFIKRKVDISKDIEKINSLLESYQLVRDDAIPLLRIVYDAAQKTLAEENNKENIPLANEPVTKQKRSELAYQIGVDIQKFRDKFKRVVYAASGESRRDRYNEAKVFLEATVTDLLYQANMTLEDTQVPELLSELHNHFIQFWFQMETLSRGNEERFNYARLSSPVPRDIIEMISTTEKNLDKTIHEINSLIDQLIELCKELK